MKTEREELLAWVDQNFDIECADQVVAQLQEILWQTHLRAAAHPAVVLDGWRIKRHEDGDIVVQKDGIGGYAASSDDSNIASYILHALAGAILAAQQAPADAGQALTCWSCKRPYTAEQRTEADGDCPHCGVEIELDEGDAGQAQALTEELPPLPTTTLRVIVAGHNVPVYGVQHMRDYGRACMALRQPAQCAAPDEREPAFSMFASMGDYREALTDWEQNQHDAQERVAFQKSVLKRNVAYDDPSMLLERNAAGSYAVVRIQGEWEGWQARAFLAPAVVLPYLMPKHVCIMGRTDGKTPDVELPIFGDGTRDGRVLFLVSLPEAAPAVQALPQGEIHEQEIPAQAPEALRQDSAALAEVEAEGAAARREKALPVAAQPMFQHTGGVIYEKLGEVKAKVGDTGWWEAVRYRSTVTGEEYVTDAERWKCSFSPVTAPPAPAAQPEAKAAPAKDEKLPTDLSHRLRETADQQPGWKPLLTQAADEIERYYGGMMNWKANAQEKDRQMAAYREQLTAAGNSQGQAAQPEQQPYGYVAVQMTKLGTVFSRSRIMPYEIDAQVCASQWEKERHKANDCKIGVVTLYTAPVPAAAPESLQGWTDKDEPVAIDLKSVPSMDMHLELALRAGPRFKCMGCKTYHHGAKTGNRCPSCDREGYLCGAFEEANDSPEWKDWEKRTKDSYVELAAAPVGEQQP